MEEINNETTNELRSIGTDPINIGMNAPNFMANTTMGNIRLSDFNGKWLILFSHPGDFTPVWAYNLGKYQKRLILLNISLIDNVL